MKIIKINPGREFVCWNCNSIYLIEESDPTASIDMLGGQENMGADDFITEWVCPVCGNRKTEWLWKLPSKWRHSILKRSGFDSKKSFMDYIENSKSKLEIHNHLTRGWPLGKPRSGFLERISEFIFR